MKLSEYSDDELIEELKHRGIKIDVPGYVTPDIVRIGGVVFDLRT